MKASDYCTRGITLREKGELDKAILNFNKAIELNPKYTEAYSNRGMTWYDLGELDKSVLDLQESLKLNPKEELARDNLEKFETYKRYLDILQNTQNSIQKDSSKKKLITKHGNKYMLPSGEVSREVTCLLSFLEFMGLDYNNIEITETDDGEELSPLAIKCGVKKKIFSLSEYTTPLSLKDNLIKLIVGARDGQELLTFNAICENKYLVTNEDRTQALKSLAEKALDRDAVIIFNPDPEDTSGNRSFLGLYVGIQLIFTDDWRNLTALNKNLKLLLLSFLRNCEVFYAKAPKKYFATL